MMARGRPSTHSAEEREAAVALARSTSIRRAAAELGIPVGTLNGWVQQAKAVQADTTAGAA